MEDRANSAKWGGLACILCYCLAFAGASLKGHAIQPTMRLAEAVAGVTLLPIGLVLFATAVLFAIQGKNISAPNKMIIRGVCAVFIIIAMATANNDSRNLYKDISRPKEATSTFESSISSVARKEGFRRKRVVQVTFVSVPGSFRCIGLPDHLTPGTPVAVKVLPNLGTVIEIEER